MYDRLVQRYANGLGYSLDRRQISDKVAYVLTRKDVNENFHDGKNPGRKGLAKRMGVNCKQSVSKLRNIAKNSSGERQRMAHWCANMKSGKNESIFEGVNIDNNLLDMIKKFLPVAQKELSLAEFPKMKPVLGLSSGEHPSFGRFVNDLNSIEFAIENRHPIDILRTLAHELVHCKQREDQRLKPDSGETGSKEENEANARAGVIMRNFDDAYPEYFKEEPVSIEEGHDYVKNNVAYNDILCPVAWTGDVLKEPVRLRLLQIAKVFINYLDIPNFKIEDVVLTGSLANYNYTRYSDFDLHIVTDYSNLQCDDLAEAFYKAKKEIWNNQHDITIGGHEVELYVEDINNPPVSAGIFSILRNKWIDTPEHNTPNIDSMSINAKVKDLVKQIDVAVNAANDPEDIKRIIEKLRKMRRAGLDQAGEFSVENLSYKVLRNIGYLDKLSKAYLSQQDSQLSL